MIVKVRDERVQVEKGGQKRSNKFSNLLTVNPPTAALINVELSVNE